MVELCSSFCHLPSPTSSCYALFVLLSPIKLEKAHGSVTTTKEFVSVECPRVNVSRVISFGKYWTLKWSVYRTTRAYLVAGSTCRSTRASSRQRYRRTVRHCDCNDRQNLCVSAEQRLVKRNTYLNAQHVASHATNSVPENTHRSPVTSYASSVCSPLQLFSTTRRQSVAACLLSLSLSLSLSFQETAEEDSALYLNACLRFIVYRVYRSVCREGWILCPQRCRIIFVVSFFSLSLGSSFSLFSAERS